MGRKHQVQVLLMKDSMVSSWIEIIGGTEGKAEIRQRGTGAALDKRKMKKKYRD